MNSSSSNNKVMEKERPNILLAFTGSVASIKAVPLLDALSSFANVQVVVTEKSKCFFSLDDIRSKARIYEDKEEWGSWKKLGDPVLHIELRKWADLCLISPLSANSLAKLANGMCDNLLTCIVRAWDPEHPLLVCPAMNTLMWDSPFTSKHLQVLEEVLHATVIPPVSKTLACGDTGVGAMANVEDIVQVVKEKLGL